VNKENKMSQKDNPEPEDEMRDEYDFSGGERGKFYQEHMKGRGVVDKAADSSPQIRIQSSNPYEARYPASRVISREALHIAKLLREGGYSVLIEPDDGTKVTYTTEKGLKEFLAEPVHMLIVGIPISVVVNILSSWLYQRFQRIPTTEEVNIVLEVDEQGSRIHYNHKGEPISEKKFQAILRVFERKAQRYERSQAIAAPDPTRPVPIFLEHTDKLVGWGRVAKDEKGLRLNDVQITHKRTLKLMEEGELGGLSVGVLIHDSTCLICNRQYVDCNHIAGQLYDGKECTNRIEGVSLAETSLVKKPVQPRATIEGIKVKRKKRRKSPRKVRSS